MNDMLRVGIISSTHGIRGEVKVFPTTDYPKQFEQLKEVTLDTGKEPLTLHIEGVKFFKNMVILKFKEFGNINEIEKYKGRDLWIDKSRSQKLAENEYFISDLIGLQVYDEQDTHLGEIRDVLVTGANDVYVVHAPGKKEILIPAIRSCILQVDVAAGRMQVHLLEGLLDL